MFCIGHSVSVLVLVLCLAQHTYSGKVLLWPGEYSHWLNMKNIMTALLEKGHQITVLIHSGTPTIKANQSSNCSFEIIPVSFTPQDTNDLVDEMLLYSLYEHDSYIQAFLKIKAIFEKTIEKNKELCLALFKNKELLEKLRRAQYDVVVTDPMFFGSELLAETLDLPFVISFRASFGNTVERLCGQLPAPPSYVPSTGMHYTDEMDFSQRLKNSLYYFSQDMLFHIVGTMMLDTLFTEMTVATLTTKFQTTSGNNVSTRTVHQELHEKGFHGWAAIRKPKIAMQNAKCRLERSKTHHSGAVKLCSL